MKNTLLSFMTCLAISTASAVDVASAVKSLGSDDFGVRMQARTELKKAFSIATAPGMSESSRLALEADLIAQLNSDVLPLTGELYLIRMLELYGSDAGATAVYPLLGDSEKEVRDSARRALVSIPGDKATGYLLNALNRAPDARRAAYLDALATRCTTSASVEIAKLLSSEDASLVASAALALGKIGDPSMVPVLAAARNTAPDSAKLLIEAALLEIGPDANIAYSLAGTGSNFAIRSGAFEALIDLDANRALQVLNSVFEKPDFAGRTLFIKAAVGAGSSALCNRVVTELSGASEQDQVIIVAAIGENHLSAYESEVLALMPNATGVLRATIIDTLGTVGGDASFDALYQAFLSDSKDQNAANAVARLKAPSADQKALDTLKQSSDAGARIASMKVLELRNVSGATELLNRAVSSPAGEVELREAALKSLEVIGDFESVKLMVQLIATGDPMMRSAQRSLKRLSLNFGDPDDQWERAYSPGLQAAVDDEARDNLVLILDSVAGPKTLTYLKDQLLSPDSTLRPAVIRTLERWPNVDTGNVWIEFAVAPGASEADIATAEKMLKKLLQKNSRTLEAEQVSLAVRAIQQGPNAAFKQSILSIYEKPNRRQIRRIKSEFKALTDDPDVGAAVTDLLNRI